jgi:branched-chain amino acid aminotransferase
VRKTDVHPDLKKVLDEFKLPEGDIGFGKVLAPIMAECEYKNGEWQALELKPYAPLSIDPTCKVLHYGQEIFEGMKAYNVDNHGPLLFRPAENLKRFNLSAERMCMPTLPEEIWMDAIIALVRNCSHLVPKNSGESLYIRPFMFASEDHLGIKPSEEFKFIVVASPSGAYFTGGSISVLVEREFVRAAPGGTGTAKTGGNYAASLKSAMKAKKVELNQSLWLDAVERKYIEELSGMNFFAVINKELHTPELNETILEGITRDSIINIARSEGLTVVERKISVEELIEQIKNEECTETFACGTAVILTPIGTFGEENGERYQLKEQFGPVAQLMRKRMLEIQEGRTPDPFNWVFPVTK